MLDFLIKRDKEEAFIDFKETLSISKNVPFAKIVKDIFAFSNYGGGFLLIGFKEKPKSGSVDSQPEEKRTFLLAGLPEDFHIDQADLQGKFNAYSNFPIPLQYHEFFRDINGSNKKFAAIYVPPSTCILKPIKDGFYLDGNGKKHTAFMTDSVLFRRGTQSIVASKEEIAWIQQRVETQGYRLSVLSGQPDQIQETLYANLLEVIQISKVVWTAPFKSNNPYQPCESKEPSMHVFMRWNSRMLTFEDISKPENPLRKIIDTKSIRMEELSVWMADEDKQRAITYLLNKELRFLTERLGLLHEPNREKFYYPCDGESRGETWIPRFRSSSTLTVAQRIWAQQLKRFIFWHVAVIARFTYLRDRLFLRLTPTLLLTDNGKDAIFGSTEGTVITRLIYNRYNSSYLNSLLFWTFKLADGKENIALAYGKILVSAKPAESKINTGILFDSPTSEPMQDIPEIKVDEGK